jgi:hypothetical protein
LRGLTYGSRISNFAKPVSDWLKKKLADGKSWQNSRDELQNIEFYQSSTKALPKLYQSSTKALQKLCMKLRKSSTKGFAAPLPTQCTGHPVNGAHSAQGGLPLEALLEALLKALLKALYGAPKLY